MTEPGKHPKEEFVMFRIHWTRGALKTLLWAVFAAGSTGLVAFWEQIAAMLAIAPVAALFAFLAFTVLSPSAFADTVVSRTEFLVTVDYDRNRKEFP